MNRPSEPVVAFTSIQIVRPSSSIGGGRRTADLIPGARFEAIEGMGHDYPPQLWNRLVGLVGELALNREQ